REMNVPLRRLLRRRPSPKQSRPEGHRIETTTCPQDKSSTIGPAAPLAAESERHTLARSRGDNRNPPATVCCRPEVPRTDRPRRHEPAGPAPTLWLFALVGGVAGLATGVDRLQRRGDGLVVLVIDRLGQRLHVGGVLLGQFLPVVLLALGRVELAEVA